MYLATLELTAAQRKAGLVESLETRIAVLRDRIAHGDSTIDSAIAPCWSANAVSSEPRRMLNDVWPQQICGWPPPNNATPRILSPG